MTELNYDYEVDREFGWEDEIEKESEYVLAPAGDYNFEVVSFERGRHPGSDKLPACPKATVGILIKTVDGQEVTIKHNMFLHSKTEGMLSAFFAAIGQKKKGEKLKMDWNKVIGSTGRCKVGVKKYNDNEYNEIKKLYSKEEKNHTNFNPGTF